MSKPSHVFESPHLKVKYDVADETATGFILDDTVVGERRRYIYEAYFRNDRWNIAFTTGDPDNTKPFSDRNRDTYRFREIKGVSRYHGKDIAQDISLKLCKFRNNILEAEKILQGKKLLGKFIVTGGLGDEYWLHDNALIRIVNTLFRQASAAIDLTDVSLDNIARYIF